MRRLRLVLDPRMDDSLRAKVTWTWRLILTTVGYSWEEVSARDGEKADVAYLGSDCPVKVETALRLDFDRTHWEGEPTGKDSVHRLFWTSTGQGEQNARRNRHGHLEDHRLSETDPLRFPPVASEIIDELAAKILAVFKQAPTPRWPQGKKAAVCLSHDVDYPEVIRWLEPLRVIKRQGLRSFGNAIGVALGTKTHWHFDSWMDLEEKYGARSAFYFVPRKGSLPQYFLGTPDPFYDIRRKPFRELFRELKDRGFEVGIHASYNAFQNEALFLEEKSLLESISGQRVVGCRHHYWHLDPKSPEKTLSLHEKIGLAYDASLANENYLGWRRGLCTPYFPFASDDKREISTVQIPTAWMDDHLFGHASENEGDPESLITHLVKETATRGGCLMVDVHDYVFDESLFPNWRRAYVYLLESLTKSGDFWMALPKEVAQHWSDRCHKIRSASVGL